MKHGDLLALISRKPDIAIQVARYMLPRHDRFRWLVLASGEPLRTSKSTLRLFRSLEQTFKYLEAAGVQQYTVTRNLAEVSPDEPSYPSLPVQRRLVE